MFSLSEIQQIAAEYRFKFNNETKSYTLIETKSSAPVFDKRMARRINACLLLNYVLTQKNNIRGFRAIPDEQFVLELQNQVIDLIKKGNYSFHTTGMAYVNNLLEHLINIYNSDNTPACYKSSSIDLFNELAKEIYLQITDLKITLKNVEQSVELSTKPLEAEEIKILEKQKDKQKTSLTEQQKQNRLKYIDAVIDVFWETASDKHKMLVNRDQFKFVSKIKEHVNKGEAIPAIPSEKILIGILIALKSNGEDYYLDCFLSDAGVNKMLLKMKKENYIQTMREEAKAREQTQPNPEEQVVEESEQIVLPENKDVSIDNRSLKTKKDAEEDLLFGALRDMMKEHIAGLQEYDSNGFDQIEPEIIEKINKVFRFLAGKSQMTCINPQTNQEVSLRQILRDAILKKGEIQIDALIKANEKNVKVVNCLETFKLVQSACDQYVLTDMISTIANNDSLKQIAKTISVDTTIENYYQMLEESLKYGYGQDLLNQMYQSSENYCKYMSKDFLSSLTIASNNLRVDKEKESQEFSLADIFEKNI